MPKKPHKKDKILQKPQQTKLTYFTNISKQNSNTSKTSANKTQVHQRPQTKIKKNSNTSKTSANKFQVPQKPLKKDKANTSKTSANETQIHKKPTNDSNTLKKTQMKLMYLKNITKETQIPQKPQLTKLKCLRKKKKKT